MFSVLKNAGIVLALVATVCFALSAPVVGVKTLMAADNAAAAAAMAAVANPGAPRAQPKSNVKIAQTAFCKRVFAACAASAAAACMAQCVPPGTARCKSCVDRYADKCARDSGCL